MSETLTMDTRTTETNLLLLTPGTESAALWESDLGHHKRNFVIATYQMDVPDIHNRRSRFSGNLDKLFALAIVDAQGTKLGPDVLEVCHRLRKRMSNPILLLTHDRTEERLLRAYALGVDDCIYKPVATELLLAKVQAWLRFSRGGPRDESSTGYLPMQ